MKLRRRISKERAIRWAGGPSRLAQRLGISRQSVHKWGEYVPPLRQLQIEADKKWPRKLPL